MESNRCVTTHSLRIVRDSAVTSYPKLIRIIARRENKFSDTMTQRGEKRIDRDLYHDA